MLPGLGDEGLQGKRARNAAFPGVWKAARAPKLSDAAVANKRAFSVTRGVRPVKPALSHTAARATHVH